MVSIRPGDNVETEFGLMVDTIYKWYSQHTEMCGEITIGFVTGPEHEESLMTYVMSLIQQEEPLRPLFLQLGRVDVTFISRDGKDQKEFKFEVS
ncbi:hypothetical protein [Pedosphaera parvula]|nr:hypothetical protein [Pedosphaera parvula]